MKCYLWKVPGNFPARCMLSFFLFLMLLVFLQPINEKSAVQAFKGTKRIMINTAPDGASIFKNTGDKAELIVAKIGDRTQPIDCTSGSYFPFDFSQAGDTVELIIKKDGFWDKKVSIKSDYFDRNDVYPDVHGQEKAIPLEPKQPLVQVNTDPKDAVVFIQCSKASPPVYFGRACEPHILDMAAMYPPKGETDYIFHIQVQKSKTPLTDYQAGKKAIAFYVVNPQPVDKLKIVGSDQKIPGKIYNIPPVEKDKQGKQYSPVIVLKPLIPLVSPLQYQFYFQPAKSTIVLLAVLATMAGLAMGVAPFIRRSRERATRLAAWETLTRRVDRDDPMFNRLIGKFRIVEKIGAGGMATVYRAVPEATLNEEESVAIKVMQGDKAESDDYTERFKREMRISTEMNHPHIMRILDFGDEGGMLYIVMELIRGKSMRKIIPDTGYDLDTFMGVFTTILQALAYAHEKKIIHRDLKPDNIMMTDQGRIVVMDFGLARHQKGSMIVGAGGTLAAQAAQASMITPTGVALGTPAYMSPEQVSGKPLDPRTDQYSLGIMAFQMLTGQLPFYDENTINIMFKQVTDAPPPLSEYRKDLPPFLEKVILQMLEKEPGDRFRNLKEVQRALEEGMKGNIQAP